MMANNNFALYHWAPRSVRHRIIHSGLLPNSISSCGEWKPPYVCLAEGPKLAWDLIGRHRRNIKHWDLWWTTSADCAPYEVLYFDTNGEPKEYRVYHRIYKRNLWLVGSRENEYYKND